MILEEVDAIAREFHETYERVAPTLGYRTRSDSAVTWEDVPEVNKQLMRCVVADLLERNIIVGDAGLKT